MPAVINFYTNMPLFLYDPIFETNLIVYKTYFQKKKRKEKDRRLRKTNTSTWVVQTSLYAKLHTNLSHFNVDY